MRLGVLRVKREQPAMLIMMMSFTVCWEPGVTHETCFSRANLNSSQCLCEKIPWSVVIPAMLCLFVWVGGGETN